MTRGDRRQLAAITDAEGSFDRPLATAAIEPEDLQLRPPDLDNRVASLRCP